MAEDNTETVKTLMKAAKEGDGRYAHAIQRARDEPEAEQQRQALRVELGAQA